MARPWRAGVLCAWVRAKHIAEVEALTDEEAYDDVCKAGAGAGPSLPLLSPQLDPLPGITQAETAIRGQGSGVRGQGSGVRGQGSGVRDATAQVELDKRIIESPWRKTLKTMFPDTFEVPKEYTVTRWSQDEFSRGSYSYVPVGASKAGPSPLITPPPAHSVPVYPCTFTASLRISRLDTYILPSLGWLWTAHSQLRRSDS